MSRIDIPVISNRENKNRENKNRENKNRGIGRSSQEEAKDAHVTPKVSRLGNLGQSHYILDGNEGSCQIHCQAQEVCYICLTKRCKCSRSLHIHSVARYDLHQKLQSAKGSLSLLRQPVAPPCAHNFYSDCVRRYHIHPRSCYHRVLAAARS